MAKEHGIAMRFEQHGWLDALPEDLCVVLFQSTRELLINVVKHSRAESADVSSRLEGGEVRIRVEDDGVGFDPPAMATGEARQSGFGLFSIRERLERLGGRLELESTRGQGTVATLVVPAGRNGEGDGEEA
jgi:signal transduction histidine kinase